MIYYNKLRRGELIRERFEMDLNQLHQVRHLGKPIGTAPGIQESDQPQGVDHHLFSVLPYRFGQLFSSL